MNINPLADRVLIRPLEEKEMKKGGIIIPDTAKEKPQEGEVIAVGKGRVNEKGERVALEVKKRRQGALSEIRRNRSQHRQRPVFNPGRIRDTSDIIRREIECQRLFYLRPKRETP